MGMTHIYDRTILKLFAWKIFTRKLFKLKEIHEFNPTARELMSKILFVSRFLNFQNEVRKLNFSLISIFAFLSIFLAKTFRKMSKFSPA